MKKIYTLFLGIFFLITELTAQAPKLINYQAAARDANGNPLRNQHISVRMSIRDGSISGGVIYQETDTSTTNSFGLFETTIGNGVVTSGSFTNINWGNGAKYLQVEFDPTGGTAYIDMGTSQLLSVPYALYSGNGLAPGTQPGNTPYWNGSKWITNNSNIYNDGVNIGIGTITPPNKFSTLGTIDFRRIARDGVNYELNMSDTLPTTDIMIPHLTMFAGEPIGIHSVFSLENTAICCGKDTLTAVMGVLDNSGPLHHTIRITKYDFSLLSADSNQLRGEYHINTAGISFDYIDTINSTSWLLSNKKGKPGQVLTLNTTADTAQWKSLNNFSNLNYSTPADGAIVTLKTGSNIIEPATSLASVSLVLPFNPSNGDLVALSFVKPITTINYSGGTIVNGTTTAVAGTTIKYIYYAAVGKWYNW